MRAVIVSAVIASGCAYKAGSFSHPRWDFVGQRASVACLDIAVERRPDLPGGGTVLAYAFGNRCDKPTSIDLANVRVEARTFDGQALALAPYDPGGEIRPMLIDGRAAGGEAIAYQADERLAEVCVDVASIAGAAGAQWLCFASRVDPSVTIAEASR